MPPLANGLLVDDGLTTTCLSKLLLSRMGATGQVPVAENGELLGAAASLASARP